jgi:hypothetical protein
MCTSTLSVILVGGIPLGVGLTFRARAEDQAKKDWSRLPIVTYASGLIGFFDPVSGKLDVYDASWNHASLFANSRS